MKTMKMTGAGDAILHLGYANGGYDGFEGVKSAVARGDARIGNLEVCITNADTYASAYCGGLWHQSDVRCLKQIEGFGFNMMGFANNHTMDLGPDGCLETVENVRRHTDIALCGAGADLFEANLPAYRDFPGGRVALIACCSSFVDAARAGWASRSVKGRPGLNPLRCSTVYTVTPEHFKALKEIAANTFMNGQRDISRKNGFAPPLPEGTFEFGGQLFRLSENGREEKITHPLEEDMKRILTAVEDAKTLADHVVILLHSHQILADEMCYPDSFAREFSQRVIDAGASAVFGGGTHELKPVEIYKGKPIFHSLGNFCFQLNTFRRQPEDMRQIDRFYDESDVKVLANRFGGWKKGLWVQRQNFESIVPYLEFENGELTRLELHPLELGFDGPATLKGLPRLADSAGIDKALDRLNELSRHYNARFTRRGDVLTLA